MDTIYVEQAVRHHPRTLSIAARFPNARVVEIDRYTEIFNRRSQNFRLQKQRPALILARKTANFVLPTPSHYGIGGQHNFYFSHMLNCLYDCRYCFLQGIYRSAHYVVFVNFEDYVDEIHRIVARLESQGPVWFFSGYDCDSLAMEPLTGFAAFLLQAFPRAAGAHLELRTKSTQVRRLLEEPVRPNWVVAYTLSPEQIVAQWEHKTPPLAVRLRTLRALQDAGWNVGLRFDPVIATPTWRQDYAALVRESFTVLDPGRIHSVTLGTFRMPSAFFDRSVRLYPYERLFAGEFVTEKGQVGYPAGHRHDMIAQMSAALRTFVPQEKIHVCESID